MLILILIFLSFFTIYVYKQAQLNLFAPNVIAGVIFIFYYLFDSIFCLIDSSKNPNFYLSNSFFTYTNTEQIIIFTLASISFWMLGDYLVGNFNNGTPNYDSFRNLKIQFRNSKLKYTRTISLLTILVLFIELLNFINFINEFGGFNYYFDHIADRALIFSEHTYFYALVQITTILGSIIAGYLIAIITTKKKTVYIISLTVLIIICILMLSLLTGARANILRPIIIMLVISGYFGKKIVLSFRSFILAVGLIIALVLFSEITRNNDTQEQFNIFNNIFNSTEVSQINNLMVLEERNLVGLEDGKTIIAGLFSFIPDSIYRNFSIEKQLGGNAIFTEKVWPERWERAKSEVALGFLGESLMNFGFIISLLIFFVIGMFYRYLYKLLVIRKKGGIFGLLIYIGVVWSIFQLLRGDLYNTINTLFIYIISCIFSFSLLKITMWRVREKN